MLQYNIKGAILKKNEPTVEQYNNRIIKKI